MKFAQNYFVNRMNFSSEYAELIKSEQAELIKSEQAELIKSEQAELIKSEQAESKTFFADLKFVKIIIF